MVKELSTGEHYSYIQEFRIENAWLLTNNLQTDMPSYTGFMVFYNTEGEYLINLELSNGTLVNYEETGKCDGSQDGSGSNSGGGGSTDGGDGPGDGGSVPGTGGPGGNFSGPASPIAIIFLPCTCCSSHAPGGCTHPIYITIVPDKKSTKNLLKNGCVAAPEECFNDVQDPCECDGNGGCVEENDEVPINVFPINIMLVSQLNSLLDQNLLPTQVQAMGPYGDELFQQMIDFLNENSTIEAQNFIHAVAETIEEVGSEGTVEVDFEAIFEAFINNILISAFPFVKYPEGSNYEATYPKLTEYLKNQLPLISDNQFIINKIEEHGDLSSEEIKNQLEWGKGPIIEIVQLDNFCSSCSENTYGLFQGNNPNTLLIDQDLVNDLENTNAGSLLADSFSFLVGVTILNEFVHYSEYRDGEWNSEESGLLFETDVYGQTVWRDNALIILKN